MPGFDETGPDGKGKKTGRGLGKCDTDEEKKPVSSPDSVRNPLNNDRSGLGRRPRRGGGRRGK